MYLLNGHEFEQTPDDEGQGKPGMLQSMGSQRIGYDWVTEKQHVFLNFFFTYLAVAHRIFDLGIMWQDL